MDQEARHAGTMTGGQAEATFGRPVDRVFVPAFAAIGAAAYAVLLYATAGSYYIPAFFVLFSVLALVAVSLELTLTALACALFVDYIFLGFSSAVWFSLVLGCAYVLHHGLSARTLPRNPLLTPLLVYLLCVLPSLSMSPTPLLNVLKMFNLVAFAITLAVLRRSLRSSADLRSLFGAYLALVTANSLHVFLQSATTSVRPFGFAGIMFVDFAGLGICTAVAASIISRGRLRFLFFSLSVVFGAALVLTQTRNVWLSVAISLAFIVAYVMVRPWVSGFTRRRLLVAVSVSAIVAVFIFAAILLMDTEVGTRATELTKGPGLGLSESGSVQNSVGSRMLIWATAYNAFWASPLVGIGMYGFPLYSHLYSTLPEPLFKSFVLGNSPHQTLFAVLSESGIVGLAGFVVLVVGVIRQTSRMLSAPHDDRSRRYAFVGMAAVTYCLVSMMFTDAWMWGQGIVLFAGVLGIMLANNALAADVQRAVEP